jgi:hypothetical protein
MADYPFRYIFTWGTGGPRKTFCSNTWLDASHFYEDMKAFDPVWLNPEGEWKQTGPETWTWSAGYGYQPNRPMHLFGPREVTRHDYWEDILYWDDQGQGETVRALFEGEEYVLEGAGVNVWRIWKVADVNRFVGGVIRGNSGEYWAGPTIPPEHNVCGNLYDTLYRLKHGKDAE